MSCTSESDIDLLVEIDGAVDYSSLFRLSNELARVTGRTFDVLTSIKPASRPYVEPDLVELPL